MNNSTNFLNLNTNGPSKTELVGQKLGQLLQPADVVCLIGGLGAGKTAFTRGVGRGWGTTGRVTSPTFTLVNEYSRPQDGKILFHLDCYRLISEDDVETIGLDDILAADGVVVIEWPQIAADWLPNDRLVIEIEVIDESTRSFQIKSSGPRSDNLMAQLKDHFS